MTEVMDTADALAEQAALDGRYLLAQHIRMCGNYLPAQTPHQLWYARYALYELATRYGLTPRRDVPTRPWDIPF